MGLSCAQCRYDLAGLDRAGLCPECGLPIRLSLSGAIGARLGRPACAAIHRGCTTVLVAYTAAGAGMLLSLLWTIALLDSEAIPFLFLPALLVDATGWWMITTPAADRMLDPMPARIGRTLTAAALCTLVPGLAGWLLAGWPWTIVTLGCVLVSLRTAAGTWWIARLAESDPGSGLRLVAQSTFALAAILAVAMSVNAASDLLPPTFRLPISGLSMLVSFLVLFPALAMILVLVTRTRQWLAAAEEGMRIAAAGPHHPPTAPGPVP